MVNKEDSTYFIKQKIPHMIKIVHDVYTIQYIFTRLHQLDWPPFLFVFYSFKKWPIKPIANYDASVILVMYWLKK